MEVEVHVRFIPGLGLPPLIQGCHCTWPRCLPFTGCFLWDFRRVDCFSIWNFLFWGSGRLVSKWKLTKLQRTELFDPKEGEKSLEVTVRIFVCLSRTPWTQESRGQLRKWKQIGGFTLTDRKQTFSCLLRGDCVSSGFQGLECYTLAKRN